ncbi:MAG TPA: ATP-binding cassette domain-containing protein [Actinomycetota bacterium]|nr:ATP-binding cassette domain-containing protein [Actinomycetota bacterium]
MDGPGRGDGGTHAVLIEGAEVSIGGRRVLGPVKLRVGRGERWALLGPNGSGKTTLLALAAALRQPSRGRVAVLGAELGRVDVRDLRARIGLLGHAVADALPRGLAALEVVLTGKRSTLVPWLQGFDARDRAEALELLELVGCAELARRPWERCSQGERQRILLARALFGRPELLLLDEPAAGLDLPGRELLVSAIDGAGRARAATSVLATHHLEDLPASTTHAALLRGGRIVAAGPVEEVLTDAALGACFGIPVQVHRSRGRWTARSAAALRPNRRGA